MRRPGLEVGGIRTGARSEANDGGRERTERPRKEVADAANPFWVKYDPDGTVAQENGQKLAGKVPGCIGCHASAGGDDYVYTNDE